MNAHILFTTRNKYFVFGILVSIFFFLYTTFYLLHIIFFFKFPRLLEKYIHTLIFFTTVSPIMLFYYIYSIYKYVCIFIYTLTPPNAYTNFFKCYIQYLSKK